jgi:hypothetical protein
MNGTNTYNWTDLPTVDGYAAAVPLGSSGYTINFAFLNSADLTSSSVNYQLPGGPSSGTGYFPDYYGTSGVDGGYGGGGYVTDFGDPITTAVQTAVNTILAPAGTNFATDYYSDVAKVAFDLDSDTNSNVQIQIGTNNDASGEFQTVVVGGVTYYAAAKTINEPSTDPNASAANGDIWLDTSSSQTAVLWSSLTAVPPGSLAFEVLLHELGHSLGLDHPASSSTINSPYYTVMTSGDNPTLPGMTVYPSGLQMDDILAIQSIYGANYTTRETNTFYGLGWGFGTLGSTSTAQFIYTIWDGGGTNVIDASKYSGPSIINLNEGQFSSIGPASTDNTGDWNKNIDDYGSSFSGIAYHNVAIAYGAIIQNAIGTEGSTIFIGNLWNNVLAASTTVGSNTFYSDQNLYPTTLSGGNLGPGIDWSENSGTAMGQTASGAYAWNDPSPNYSPVPPLKDDVLIGYGNGNTFHSGTGSNVIDGGYNKSDIDSATSGINTMWGDPSSASYWDAAGQFTGTNNLMGPVVSGSITGQALADLSDTLANINNTVNYSTLNLDDPAIVSGGAGIIAIWNGVTDVAGNPEYTVHKGAAGVDGTDTLINIQAVVGSAGNNTFIANGPLGTENLELNDWSGQNKEIFNMGPSPIHYVSGVPDGYLNGVAEINDTSGQNTVVIESSTHDMLVGVSLAQIGSSTVNVPGMPDGDNIYELTTQSSNPAGATFVALDLTTMAAGTGVSNIDIGGYTFNGEAFASAVLAGSIPLGTSLTPTALNSDVYGSGDPTSVMPAPVYNPDGTLEGQVAPFYADSGLWMDPSLGAEIDHPWVVTGFSETATDIGWSVVYTLQTYVDALWMYEAASDIRIVWTGSGSDNLNVYAVSEGKAFSVPDFTHGMSFTGIGVWGSADYDTFSSKISSLSSSGAGNYSATFDGSGSSAGSTITLGSSFSLTYYLESMLFSDGTFWDMQSGPLTFTSALDDQALYARNGHDDTLAALNNYNVLTGSDGNNTMIAGPGSIIYNGTGTDTDVFSAASASTTYGGDELVASTSGGTASIVLHGIAPSAVTMWDTIGGELLIQFSSTDQIAVFGGTYNSSAGFTMGSTTEIIFDDATIMSLTGGLNLIATGYGQSLYGTTGGGDTLTAGGTANTLVAFGGTETLIAGPEAQLYNGTGTDTDVFSSGAAPVSYGGDYVYANTSGGTGIIHLQGIDPSDVIMWDTIGGALAIQYSSTDVIHVQGGSYSSSTGLTLAGLNEITFDSSYATTWDTTGGLHLTAASDYQTLYGTSGGGDTLTADGTGDTLTAFAGAETLVAGVAAQLNNGSGTDTDVFSAGVAPISSGGDYIYTNTSGGTGIIDLHGIAPSAVTMWDTSGGQLIIQYSSTDQIHVSGGSYSSTAGVTLAGLNEITFDSSYATTWDTTGGLHLTAASDYQTLYGTSGGGDTLTAGGTGDTLMAFAGAETLVAGPGAQLYNGTGNDIDVINSGSSPAASSATIYANASGGSDNVIALHDVVAGDITMWDTTGGNLIIATPTDQFTVTGGSYNSTTGFAMGNIDHIALDDSSTINLQGGLNLTSVNDSQSIYGTGHGDNLTAAGNYDNLYGIAGNNTMTGDSSTAYFFGGSGNDLMIGGSGTNNMTMGTGNDEIKIEGSSSTTNVTGFDVAHDTIHLEDVMSGFDALTDALSNWVQKTESGGSTVIAVDPTGAGSFSAGPQVTLNSVTGLDDIATLVAHGVVHV